MPNEIERKFLVSVLPEEVLKLPRMKIVQGYLALDANGHEVRLRRMGTQFYLTVKSDGTIERKEFETELSEAQFDALWEGTLDRRLRKDRYILERETHKIDIDIYHQPLKGLIVAEVEFSSLEEAGKYQKESWMSREVTHLSFLKNKNLLQFETYEDLKDLL